VDRRQTGLSRGATGCDGQPSPGIDLAVIDELGNRLTAGQEGDIAVSLVPQRPVGLFTEYWKNPEAMAASFTPTGTGLEPETGPWLIRTGTSGSSGERMM
jgi:acyl-coenzyme A synthetase/AMP-(fatty) acid ligase